jgi:pantothenate kinase
MFMINWKERGQTCGESMPNDEAPPTCSRSTLFTLRYHIDELAFAVASMKKLDSLYHVGLYMKNLVTLFIA